MLLIDHLQAFGVAKGLAYLHALDVIHADLKGVSAKVTPHYIS